MVALDTTTMSWSSKGMEYPSNTRRWVLASSCRRWISARRLPKLIKSASSVVHMYNHGENLSTSIRLTPAPTLSTKPEATKNTSSIGTCFKRREYKTLSRRYIVTIQPKAAERSGPRRKKLKTRVRAVRMIADPKPSLTDIFPDARGRFRFVGCFRSASRSAKSLMM